MKKILFASIFLLVSVFCFAQDMEQINNNRSYALSVSPQYIITGGMRLDLDVELTDRTCLTIAPIFYYKNNTSNYDPYEMSYSGGGAFLNYRYFPTSQGVYTALGLNYRYLNADYYDSYSDDEEEENAKFNTGGFDLTLGYQFRLIEELFMDIYFGMGFRYTDQNTIENDSYWTDSFFDLGYSGFLPVLGLRIGFDL